MKHAILLICFLISTGLSHAIGLEVIDDMTELKDRGFVFEQNRNSSDKVIALNVIVPKDFDTEGAGRIKPFWSITFFQPLDADADGERLIGGMGNHFPLASTQMENGKRQVSMSVMANSSASYIVVIYSRGKSGDIPHLVYIPISCIQKHIKDEQIAAPNR